MGTTPKSTLRALGSYSYKKAKQAATAMLDAPARLLNLIQNAQQKLRSRLSHAQFGVVADIKTGMRLVQAFARREYRDIAAENLVLIVAALVYFVAPIDLIPDIFLALGLSDDLAILAWTFNRLREELQRFERWELQQHNVLTPDTKKLANDAEQQIND